jgi:hypothetical protein
LHAVRPLTPLEIGSAFQSASVKTGIVHF